MTCSATLRHNAGEALAVDNREDFGLETTRARATGRRRAPRGRAEDERAPGRKLAQAATRSAGAFVLALAANLAWAAAPLSAGPAPTDRGATGLLAEPKFDLAPAGQIAPRDDAAIPPASASQKQAAPDNPPVVYDPTAGPTLSPMQSALRAAMERLVTRADRVNPLGSGDWRAARGAIAAFYAARFYAPIWVGEDGLTEAGRSALSQLERAGEDGLDLSSSRCRARSAPALLRMRSPTPRPQSPRRS